MSMNPTTTGTLRVPGASLYYEIRGAGPVLLLVCGGVYDAAGYAGLAGQLAGRYTVVTYDRRGNSRSPLDGPPEQQRIEVHGDDAHRVLAAVGVTNDEPAHVFGKARVRSSAWNWPPATPGRCAPWSRTSRGYEVPPFARYTPDIAALKASQVRVVMAVGEASRGEPPYRAALAVAERLGTDPVVFPGDHGGFGSEPVAFAAKLHGVLTE